jgi:hypothetical protein
LLCDLLSSAEYGGSDAKLVISGVGSVLHIPQGVLDYDIGERNQVEKP